MPRILSRPYDPIIHSLDLLEHVVPQLDVLLIHDLHPAQLVIRRLDGDVPRRSHVRRLAGRDDGFVELVILVCDVRLEPEDVGPRVSPVLAGLDELCRAASASRLLCMRRKGVCSFGLTFSRALSASLNSEINVPTSALSADLGRNVPNFRCMRCILTKTAGVR